MKESREQRPKEQEPKGPVLRDLIKGKVAPAAEKPAIPASELAQKLEAALAHSDRVLEEVEKLPTAGELLRKRTKIKTSLRKLGEMEQEYEAAKEFQPFDWFSQGQYDLLAKDGLLIKDEAEGLKKIDDKIKILEEKIKANPEHTALPQLESELVQLKTLKTETGLDLEKRVGVSQEELRENQEKMLDAFSVFVESEKAALIAELNKIETNPAVKEKIKAAYLEETKRRAQEAENIYDRSVEPALTSVDEKQKLAFQKLEGIGVGREDVDKMAQLTWKIQLLENKNRLSKEERADLQSKLKERAGLGEKITKLLTTGIKAEKITPFDLLPNLWKNTKRGYGDDVDYLIKARQMVLTNLKGGNQEQQDKGDEAYKAVSQALWRNRILKGLAERGWKAYNELRGERAGAEKKRQEASDKSIDEMLNRGGVAIYRGGKRIGAVILEPGVSKGNQPLLRVVEATRGLDVRPRVTVYLLDKEGGAPQNAPSYIKESLSRAKEKK